VYLFKIIAVVVTTEVSIFNFIDHGKKPKLVGVLLLFSTKELEKNCSSHSFYFITVRTIFISKSIIVKTYKWNSE
jgi:hypothetical protein